MLFRSISNAGTFNYARGTPPKIRGTAGSNCERDVGYQVTVHQRIGGALLKRQTEIGQCGQPFAITDLSPGAYRLFFMAVRDGVSTLASTEMSGTRFFATAEINVADGADLDVQVKLVDAAGITGKVICECEKVQLATEDRPRIQFLPPEENGLVSKVEVRDDGTFEGRVGIVGPARVVLENFRPDLYIKRFVYAGSEAGHTITATPGSNASVEITMAEGPATVKGNGGKSDHEIGRASCRERV